MPDKYIIITGPMNYKHTLKAAMADLQDIANLLDTMYNKDTFSAIELDLALQKVRNIYDIMLMIRPEEKNIAMNNAKSELVDEASIKGIDSKQVIQEQPPVAQQEKDTPERTSGNEGDVMYGKEKKNPHKVLSDKLGDKKLLHDNLHQKVQYKDLSSRVQARPISDISTAIGINERFLFIRELFNNDARKYENAIRVLNDSANFNEAYNYMIREYAWDMDSELVQGLLEIVRRKFISGQNE